MKTKKQQIILGIIFLSIFVIGFIFVFTRKGEIQLIVPFDQNYSQEKIDLKQEFPLVKRELRNVLEFIPEIKKIEISLEVSDLIYKIKIEEGDSVFEAMREIQENNNTFSFKYKETPGLGNFITEINGLKGSPGKYWIYYINNKKATIGASQFILKEGDIIRWNQEGL